jgi:DNA-binding NarL/FixJ family response regulator
MLSRMTVVCSFDNAEKAINFCLEYGIGAVIIDLDSPTDVHVAMDVYFALTILNPAIRILLCTKSTISLEARTLHAKGAELFQKPFLRPHAEELVHSWLG